MNKLNSNKLLFSLGNDLVRGILLRRPSNFNKSPYVGDVELIGSKRVTRVHLPSLNLGGECTPGSEILMSPAREKNGELVRPESKNAMGNQKCEFIAKCVKVSNPIHNKPQLKGVDTWIGAHPTLGEKQAKELIAQNYLTTLPKNVEIKTQAMSEDGYSRHDFLLTPKQGKKIILEVKTAPDVDIKSFEELTDLTKRKEDKNYSAVVSFPWGSAAAQKGPDGEKVVSSRSIKHMMQLSLVAQKEQAAAKNSKKETFKAVLLFIIARHDACAFMANARQCPSFSRYLEEARESGVQIIAHRVRWGSGKELGSCFSDGDIPIIFEKDRKFESDENTEKEEQKVSQGKKKVKPIFKKEGIETRTKIHFKKRSLAELEQYFENSNQQARDRSAPSKNKRAKVGTPQKKSRRRSPSEESEPELSSDDLESDARGSSGESTDQDDFSVGSDNSEPKKIHKRSVSQKIQDKPQNRQQRLKNRSNKIQNK